jgi:prevent-host-death family protein
MSEMISVSATEANRSFSKLLREVADGNRVRITSHGRPVALIVPDNGDSERRKKQLQALAALKARWATQEPIVVGPWTREELYERD